MNKLNMHIYMVRKKLVINIYAIKRSIKEMKIVEYELFIVPPRWLFLNIQTDEGITGWGEPIIEGRAKTVKAAVEELMEYLIGKNPLHIEDHWNMLYRSGFYRGGPILMSAIAG